MALAARHGRAEPRAPKRVRPGDDGKHRAMVSRLPCLVCGAEEPRVTVDPHHLLRAVPAGERGMRRRAADRFALPLCREHHTEVHDDAASDDEAWLAAKGIQGREVADALWARRGDPEAMRAYVVRSLFDRGVYIK